MTVQEIFSQIADENAKLPQSLTRTKEPEQVTSAPGSVNDYQAMMKTNITANYAIAIDLIARTRGPGRDRVLDLCCGPGHVTLCLQKYLNYKNLKGLDLSAGMIAAAQENLRQENLGKNVSFALGDAAKLDHEPVKTFDLVSFTNAAHHFPDLNAVTSVIKQAERVVKSDGLIFISDLARLKSDVVTQKFVAFAGADYGDFMREDFLNSMRAAWLPEELASAVPDSTHRTWYSVAFGGLPFFQALIGLPEGRQELFLNPSFDWPGVGIFPNPAAHEAFLFMKACLDAGNFRKIQHEAERAMRRAS